MKKDFLLIAAVYLLACTAVLPFVKWYVDNPDSLQYVSIAHHILGGRWALAVNGYWSPLISWMLVPFIYIFDDGIIAFKYLQMAIGVYVIAKWLSFLSLTEIEDKWKRVLGFAIIPFVISYSLNNLTPDLLFVGILFALIVAIIRWLEKQSDGQKIGQLGALLYLTKAFALPLFIFLFAITYWMKDERLTKATVKKIIYPFILISGIWILCLSIKYGKFTISESAKFNFTYEVAPIVGKDTQLPVLGNGLLKPANDFAVSAWEEPASQVRLTSLDPIHDLSYYGKVVKRNVLSIYYHDFRHQIGSVFLLLFVIYLIRKKKEKRIPVWVIISLLVIVGLYFGYSLILVHERYIWICSLLFLPTTFFFVKETFPNIGLKQFVEIGLIAFLLFAIKRPMKEVILCGDRSVNKLQLFHTFISPMESMEVFYRKDKQLHDDIEKLKRIIPESSNFASIRNFNPERDGYASSLLIAYELHGKYWGQTQERDSTFKGYLVRWKEEVGEKVFDSDGGVKVYRR